MKVKNYHYCAHSGPDLDQAMWLYGEVLGLRQLPRPESSVQGPWYEMSSGQQLHVMLMEGERQARGEQLALEVDDFESAVKALQDNDVRVVGDPRVQPDGSDTVNALDLGGNMIELTHHK